MNLAPYRVRIDTEWSMLSCGDADVVEEGTHLVKYICVNLYGRASNPIRLATTPFAGASPSMV